MSAWIKKLITHSSPAVDSETTLVVLQQIYFKNIGSIKYLLDFLNTQALISFPQTTSVYVNCLKRYHFDLQLDNK